MSKKIERLWVFGDSNSTPNFLVEPKNSFWGLAARKFDIVDIFNISRAGCSLASVAHLLISMQQQYTFESDLFLVGVPPLERVTFFDQGKKTEYRAARLDGRTWRCDYFNTPYHLGLINWNAFSGDKNMVLHENRSWTETDALRQIYLMSQWLKSRNANYVILNLSRNFDKQNQWGPTDFLLPEMLNDPNCILFDNSYRDCNININWPADFDLLQWDGHHGASGNQHFYDVAVRPKLEELFC